MGAIQIKDAGWYSPNNRSFYQPHRLKNSGSGVAAAPDAPENIASWYFGFTSRSVTRVGTSISANPDVSGNARTATYSANATYQASAYDGNPGVLLPSTALATYATSEDPIVVGAAHGWWGLIWDTTEAGNYYHTVMSIKSVSAGVNMNVVVSSDILYGTFFNILPATLGVAIGIGVQDFATRPRSLIVNYNGGSITSAASYTAWLDNTSMTVSGLAGTAANSARANQINSYANASPPQFPFKDGRFFELFFKQSVIDATQRAAIKTWLQYYFPSVTQA